MASPVPYNEIVYKTTRITAPCAIAIWLSTAIAAWPQWNRVAIVLAAMVTMVVFNVLSNLRAAAGSPHSEIWRAVANTLSTNIVGHLLG